MFKTISIAILALFSLSSFSEDASPPDGKVTLYYEDGSKKGIKEYKDGQPIGTWMSWYKDGKIENKIVFELTSSPHTKAKTGKFLTSITDVEVRYPNENNTIRFKGISFHLERYLMSTDTGESYYYPNWTHIIESYDEDGNIRSEGKEKTFGIEDVITGITHTMPWIVE